MPLEVKPKKPSTVALAGLASALSMAALWAGFLIPISRTAFLIATSIILYISIRYASQKIGLIAFVSTVLLGFLLIPSRSVVFSYLLIFGMYPLWKGLLLNMPRKIQWVLKLAFLNAMALGILWVAAWIVGDLFPIWDRLQNWHKYIVLCVIQGGYVIYDILLDYTYVVFHRFYHRHFTR